MTNDEIAEISDKAKCLIANSRADLDQLLSEKMFLSFILMSNLRQELLLCELNLRLGVSMSVTEMTSENAKSVIKRLGLTTREKLFNET